MTDAVRPTLLASILLLAGTSSAHAEEHTAPMLDPHHHGILIYPPAELERHQNGTAHIRCTISDAGFATDCQTTASQPDFALAAENLVYSSTFLPAYENGVAIQGAWEYTYTFHTSPDLAKPTFDKAHSRAPYFPEAADVTGLGGKITVTCKIDPIGVAHECSASKGPTLLQKATLAYFSLARYYPAFRDGNPVESTYEGSVNWDNSHPIDQKGFR
ncbi:hypothetical protein HKD22_04990 [Gluconobacter kanchanaburiensis]|nr:hypothetical protein [Gluconobacter kanchanaburiensis]